jgi:hypothetical protein
MYKYNANPTFFFIVKPTSPKQKAEPAHYSGGSAYHSRCFPCPAPLARSSMVYIDLNALFPKLILSLYAKTMQIQHIAFIPHPSRLHAKSAKANTAKIVNFFPQPYEFIYITHNFPTFRRLSATYIYSMILNWCHLSDLTGEIPAAL